MALTIVKHALIDHYITILRNKQTSSEDFRNAARKVSRIMAVAVSQDLPLGDTTIETPLEVYHGQKLNGTVVAVPILRAGLALVDAVSDIVPNLAVGHIGLKRDEETAKAISYFMKLPECTEGSTVLLLDPMLATGGSAIMAIDLVMNARPASIRLVTVLAAPEGVAAVEAAHPQVQIYTGALDRELNSSKFILPGLGDFGDRICNT
jgi:uracil phosphoribosyltransferase